MYKFFKSLKSLNMYKSLNLYKSLNMYKSLKLNNFKEIKKVSNDTFNNIKDGEIMLEYYDNQVPVGYYIELQVK